MEKIKENKLIFYAAEKNPKSVEFLCKDKRDNRCICKKCYKIELSFDEYYNKLKEEN